jgi:methylamine dehydrogenase light chain
MNLFDEFTERSGRALARRSSRRSFLGRVGALLCGAAAIPLLPVARGAQPPDPKNAKMAKSADPGDPAACDYWRHCAIDGF